MAHKIEIVDRYNSRIGHTQYQPRCKACTYRGAWKIFKGEAIQNGRRHVQESS